MSQNSTILDRLPLLIALVAGALGLLWSLLRRWSPPERGRPQVRWEAVVWTLVPLALLVTLWVFLGAGVLQQYGLALFVAMPFAMGLASSLIHGGRERRTLEECLVVAVQTVIVASALLVVFALEGLVCILMALPLTIVLGWLGALLGYFIQHRFWSRREAPALLLLLLLSTPVLMGVEAALDREPPVFAVSTAVLVDAPPAAVWRRVVSFPALSPPRDAMSRLGIAYPVSAEIRGRGVGAVRYCRFSTGPFVEPITVWDEPRLLRFAVTANPPAMRELSPYPDLHPPHLDGFLLSRQGQFRLIPLPGGRTRLVGTTWYRHGLWPAAYWRLWSDWTLHRIHRRVLEHVAALAEADVAAGRMAAAGSGEPHEPRPLL